MHHRTNQHVRRGTALVLALAFLALGAALLVGSAGAGRRTARAALTREAVLEAGATVKRIALDRFAAWGDADDSLAIGAERADVRNEGGGSDPSSVACRSRLRRVALRQYVVSAECRVGPELAPVAVRRVQVLVIRPEPDSVHSLQRPRLLPQWSFAWISQ